MSCKASRHRGFTLVEVLVALVIVGLGMLAVFGQLNQSLIATALVRERTLAQWIALDRITELRINGEFPDVGERSDELSMGGVNWVYTLKFSEVGVENFRRVDVTVSFADSPDRTVGSAAGFLGRPQQFNVALDQSWVPLDPNAALTEGETQ